jgi:hypothetical protein
MALRPDSVVTRGQELEILANNQPHHLGLLITGDKEKQSNFDCIVLLLP